MKRWFVISFSFFIPTVSQACAVCFGGADSNLIKGFTWGVAFLATLPFALMLGLGSLIYFSSRKARTRRS